MNDDVMLSSESTLLVREGQAKQGAGKCTRPGAQAERIGFINSLPTFQFAHALADTRVGIETNVACASAGVCVLR